MDEDDRDELDEWLMKQMYTELLKRITASENPDFRCSITEKHPEHGWNDVIGWMDNIFEARWWCMGRPTGSNLKGIINTGNELKKMFQETFEVFKEYKSGTKSLFDYNEVAMSPDIDRGPHPEVNRHDWPGESSPFVIDTTKVVIWMCVNPECRTTSFQSTEALNGGSVYGCPECDIRSRVKTT